MDFLEDLFDLGDRKRGSRGHHEDEHHEHDGDFQRDRDDRLWIGGARQGPDNRSSGDPAILRCPACKSTVSAQAKFCERCGDPLPAPAPDACPDCGAALKAGARFCPECGRRR
jgi:RNA polymerase subunit RPABC4/transcription elongation factor Spt4